MNDPAPPSESTGTTSGSGLAGKLVRVGLLVIAAVFIVVAARNLARDWDASSVEVAWFPAIFSCVFIFAAGILQGLAWTLLIRSMAKKPAPFGPSIALFAASYLARYVPFKVGIVGVRVAGASGIGVPRAAVASSFFVEFLSWTVTGGAIGMLPLLLDPEPNGPVMEVLGRWSPLGLAGFAVLALLLVVVDRGRIPAGVLSRLKLEGEGPLLPWTVPLVHALAWGMWAAHGYLVSVSVGASGTDAAATMAFYVLAPVAGFLAVAAPAGVGVREAILSLGVSPAVGATAALSAAIIARGVTLVMDLAFWLATRSLRAREAASPDS